MRRQSAKLITQYSTLVGLLSLTACSTGISSADQYAPSSNYKGLEICDQKPSEGATNVALNGRIAITFDDVLDGWSVSEDNIQVWTTDGARFGGKLILNHDIVSADSSTPNCPQSKPVSRVVIAPGSGASFSPGKTYKVLFRDRNSQTDATSKVILGLAAQDTGARLQQQVTTFTTGTNLIGGQSQKLEFIGITPGKILNRNGDGSSDTLGNLASSLFTFDRRASIQITANTYFRQSSWDQQVQATQPIPPTPLYTASSPSGFIGVALGIVSSNTQLNALLAKIPQTIDNPSAWAQALQSDFYDQIPATVESPDRLNLIIKPQRDYPDSSGQVVVVILQGFLSRATLAPQKQQVYVGMFWHQGTFQQDIGMPDPKTWLKDGLLK